MKVVVSIPDPIFAAADLLAKRLKTTRSDMYARALDAFLDAHAPERVTQAMNDVVDRVGADPHALVQAAMHRVLNRVEW